MICMRFGDRNTRNERRKTDKTATIRDILTLLVENSQYVYSLKQNATIGGIPWEIKFCTMQAE